MALGNGRRSRSLALGGAALAVLLAPGIALADTGGGPTIGPRVDNGVTVDVVGATLNNKLMATIRFTVVCDEITYFDGNTYQEVTTTDGRLYAEALALQAQGRSIASATGFSPSTAVVCDGVTLNHLSVAVIAQALPLKSGAALVGVSGSVGAVGAEGEGGFGASGPTAVKLGR